MEKYNNYTSYAVMLYDSRDKRGYEYTDNYVFCLDDGKPVPEIISSNPCYVKDPIKCIIESFTDKSWLESEYDILCIKKIIHDSPVWIDITGDETDNEYLKVNGHWVFNKTYFDSPNDLDIVFP
jgi:hypothetical protein